jgi:hypothetical protein
MKYSRLGWTAVIAAFAISIGAAPAAAKGGSAKPKQPTAHVHSAKAKPVKAANAGHSTMAGAKTKAPAPKVASNAKPKASGSKHASAKPAPAMKDGTATLSSTANSPLSSTAKESRPSDTSPTPTLPLNKAQQKLMKNDNLRLKMQTRLGGMDPVVAASGFKNLGQFVAAVNASYNDPAIQFRSLKALMTGDPAMSLGQAKQHLKANPPPVATVTVLTPSTRR